VGHSILVICYHVLERGVPYEELGEDYLDRRRSGEAYAKRLVRQLERLGHILEGTDRRKPPPNAVNRHAVVVGLWWARWIPDPRLCTP
jgi:hypothetical protein